MATTQAAASRLIRTEEGVGVRSQSGHAIYWWTAVGFFFVVLNLWIYGNQYAAGDMHRIDPGPTPVPKWMTATLFGNDVVCGIIILWTFYYVVYRPWRQTGQPSFNGLLCLGLAFCVWQDPLFNYATLGFSYSTVPFNIGGWACHIPGWMSPGGCRVAEPIIWNFAFYFSLSVGALTLSTKIMRAAKARYPGIRTGTMFLVLALCISITTLLFEEAWILMGIWQYGGANPAFSLFDDARYKFATTDLAFVPLLFSFWTMIVWNRNDKGETWAERGLDEVRAGAGAKSWMRFFALTGILNVAFLLGYSIPCILVQLHSSEWPPQIQSKSYFTNGICGEGTAYACGGMNVPIPRVGRYAELGSTGWSISVGPNGQLVVPPGTKVPTVVRLER